MKRLSIAYITEADPRSKLSWSGTNYYMMSSIERHLGDVTVLGPMRPQPEWLICQVLNFISLRLLGKRFNYRDSFFISRGYARTIHMKLKTKQYDMIIAPSGTASTASLRTNIPVVYINDRCVANAIDYHPILTNLFSWSAEESIACEQKAIEKSVLTVYSSQWAADAAKKMNPRQEDKITVIPFGANLDTVSDKKIHRTSEKKLKLLFTGVKWQEKGGDIAFDALLFLLSKNVAAELIICGCVPPDHVRDHPAVRAEGFLSKQNTGEYERLLNHFATADFFILPTRFEAYGLVFCEAAAYGLPSLATRTGGIPSIIEDGKTGFLFDLSATGKAYGEKMMELMRSPGDYSAMRANARQRFESQLNWDAFGSKLRELVSRNFK